jgi:hypothetical protein
MTSAVIGGVMITLILGFTAGWVTGWAARGDWNRQWRESFDRKLRAAEARAIEAEAQAAEAVAAADHAYAVMERVPAATAPAVVHVHVAQPLGYGAVGAIADAAVPALIAGQAQVRDG